ncbi:MAG: DsbA family oxidoreductase [Pseudomonadales bacterium]
MLIEIFSDVVCPWCYIGKRRLDAVLESAAGEGVEVAWRPFQLYPQLPPEGMPRAQFMRARFGEGAQPGEIYRRIVEEARGIGLELDFEAIDTAPNTFLAHRLLSWAEGSGRQHELAEVLFQYYFRRGENVGDPVTLARAAAEAGLDAGAAEQFLGGTEGSADVELYLQLGRQIGVTGVPFYLLAGRFAIPGAQSSEVMAQFITRARERLAAEAEVAG